jgi:hypothetical protein
MRENCQESVAAELALSLTDLGVTGDGLALWLRLLAVHDGHHPVTAAASGATERKRVADARVRGPRSPLRTTAG